MKHQCKQALFRPTLVDSVSNHEREPLRRGYRSMMYDYCAGESVVARVRGMRGSPPQKSLRPIYVVSAHGSSVLHRDRRYADHGCPADFSKRLVWPLFKQL